MYRFGHLMLKKDVLVLDRLLFRDLLRPHISRRNVCSVTTVRNLRLKRVSRLFITRTSHAEHRHCRSVDHCHEIRNVFFHSFKWWKQNLQSSCWRSVSVFFVLSGTRYNMMLLRLFSLSIASAACSRLSWRLLCTSRTWNKHASTRSRVYYASLHSHNTL